MTATKCAADEVGGVEAFMRDRFKTLDGLGQSEFKEEARAAYANLKALWAEGKERPKRKLKASKKKPAAEIVVSRRGGRTVVRAKSLGNTDLRDVFGPPVAASTVRYGAVPVRSAAEVLEVYSTKQAWTALSERDLLLAFIEEEGLLDELDVFLKRRVHEENS